ncbi:MAG: hypothetical protein V7K77_16845 [Nostoc sp.]|uniref:hypothetical protein n=1 Tax=Nostoc sp. TaxID=1180 RepID=UPI002FFB66AB
MSDIVVGLDLGTGGVRAIAVNLQGQIYRSVNQKLSPVNSTTRLDGTELIGLGGSKFGCSL